MKTFVWLIGVFGFGWDREWHQHHGSWCMKSIATKVHLSLQRISHWSLEKCLLHGNVLFPCNRLSISMETYSYFGKRCTLWSIVWCIFVTMNTTCFVMRRFFWGLLSSEISQPSTSMPHLCVELVCSQRAVLWHHWQIVVILNFWGSSGWFISHSWLVGWLSATTMCSGSLINLPARPVISHGGGYGSTQLLTFFWTFTRCVQKESAGDKSTGLFPELTLEELVFLGCEYYSIFLLQQEASALWNTFVINNNGILIHFS
jgi:hypothetical protein